MPRFCAPILTIALALSLAACDEVPDLSLPNEPPQAVDDEVELLQDASLTIDVTANDIDVDGNVNLVEVVAEPDNGAVEVVTGVVVYTPDRLFAGTDTFDYRITDLEGESDEATVTVTVKNRQTRALFAAEDTGLRRLYMLDSRQPDAVVELSEAFEATESLRGWAYDDVQQEAVMLTDADRIAIVPLSDPSAAEFFAIDLEAGETVDDGFDILPLAGEAAFSVNHRFVRTFNLDDGTFESVDTGWTDSTMEILFYSTTSTAVLMSGTLGDPPVTAFYQVSTDGAAPDLLFEAEDATGTISANADLSANEMVWLLEQPGETGAGPFSCQNPPEQRLSSLSSVSLLDVATIVDLNAASGLLPDGTDIISYDPSPTSGRRVYVAACPPGVDIVQLIEIPLADATGASVLSTENDASDAFYGVDVASGAVYVIYVADGDTGLRPVLVDRSDTSMDPVVTSLADATPGFETFTDGMVVRAPASAFSTDSRRWLFVAPDGGEPTLLTWLDLDGLTTASTTLPFATTEPPVSDGYLAFVTAGTDAAIVRLDGTPATAVTLPGTPVRAEGALAVSPVVFAPVSLADTP